MICLEGAASHIKRVKSAWKSCQEFLGQSPAYQHAERELDFQTKKGGGGGKGRKHAWRLLYTALQPLMLQSITDPRVSRGSLGSIWHVSTSPWFGRYASSSSGPLALRDQSRL